MKKTDPVDQSRAGSAVPATVLHALVDMPGLAVFARSRVRAGEVGLCLALTDAGERRLCILAPGDSPALSGFAGDAVPHAGQTLIVAPLTHPNALALRAELPWLRPQPLGLLTSAGCGDRLGLATPGHAKAAQRIANHYGPAAPRMIFAQQSIREMARAGRSPDEVMDDATWGIFQEGWQAGVGADADHLKTTADIDRCVAAGFTFYTIDPGDYVQGAADQERAPAIEVRYEALPWYDLESSPTSLVSYYARRRFDLPDGMVTLDEPVLKRAAAKYGRAVAHTVQMYRYLAGRLPEDAFELEVSVDETETPTSHAEHLYVASELQRLGVRWVSLAPRFVGRFEKGVDYIGDLTAFERDFQGHAAIAQLLGPYKLSLHSGSDKFSIYGIAARHARGLLHLKTAGTSYVEALRAVAGFDPAFFRELYAFAVERYPADRSSYHVSAEAARVPDIRRLPDRELPGLLDQFDARQVLHVTFGSVLTSQRGFKERLFAGLRSHADGYDAILEQHFVRHLEPLARGA